MRRKTNWNERYVTGDIPWDAERYDFNLSEIVTKRPIRPCRALEVGCGTGSNVLWLCRQDFSVTALDVSELAIQRARENFFKAGLNCKFFVLDFLKQKICGAPFSFVFDRGCFHSFDSAIERSKYAKTVRSYLKKDGLWLTLVGSIDEPVRNPGPPQRSARDITTAVEPYFKILSLYTSHFDSDMKKPPKSWVCLMQKR